MNRIKSFDQWNNWSRTNENEKDCDCGEDRESIDREEFEITEAPETEETNPSLEIKMEEPTMEEPVITVEEPVESTEEDPAKEEIEAAETEEEVEDVDIDKEEE